MIEIKKNTTKPILTKDGTFTMHSSLFDECYHSVSDGALSESLQKHIIPAFSLLPNELEEINILDICFGLGYNTLATLYYIKKEKIDKKINIFSPEIDKALIESLKDFEYPKEFEEFKDIILKLVEDKRYKDDKISIELYIGDARDMLKQLIEKEIKIDIVYQDAFSPKKNPTLWTQEYFADIKALSKKHTIITTYSSATPVRMGMYINGFNIYKSPSLDVRVGTIASLSKLPLESVDMEHKIKVNPNAKALRDSN